jgi:hypothetical protein
MKKLFAFCIFAASVVSANVAHAQSYTFVTTPKTSDGVGGARPDGTTFGGQMTTGTTELTWADGKKSSAPYKCMGVSMPPNDTTYNFRMVCDSESAEGASSTIWGCTAPAKDTGQILCTGWAFGKSGIYAGKRGTMTFIGAQGKGSGTGNWAM